MIVLDASAMIAHFTAKDIHHRQAQEILIATGTRSLFVSCITLAQILVTPAKAEKLAEIGVAINTLGIKELPLPPESATLLAQIRASAALNIPDCCVVLAAQHAGAEIATFDKKLAAAAEDSGISIFRG